MLANHVPHELAAFFLFTMMAVSFIAGLSTAIIAMKNRALREENGDGRLSRTSRTSIGSRREW